MQINTEYNTPKTYRAAEAQKAAEALRTGNDYLQELKDKYPKANIGANAISNGSSSALQSYAMGKEGEFNDVAIHPVALEKFANDPAAAAHFEKELQGFLASEQQDRQTSAANGMEMTGRGMTVDKDGNIGAWATGVSSMGDDSQKSGTELRAEYREKAIEKAREKKAEEKKVEEKREAKRKEQEERLDTAPQKALFATGNNTNEALFKLTAAAAEDGSLDITV